MKHYFYEFLLPSKLKCTATTYADATYKNWAKGQPEPETRLTGDCAFKDLVDGEREKGWHDYPCNYSSCKNCQNGNFKGMKIQALCEKMKLYRS